ncbi:MAG: potassium channel family protein [Pyrinomonadaceae bacterium]
MRTIIFTSCGVALLLLVVYDVYATILHARGRSGPIGETLNRSVWLVVRAVAFRLSRLRRHKLLNVVGPLLLPLLIILFIGLLIAGFALIYFPRMPASFNVAPDATSPAWIEALYFSGITLTTVGYGDIAPRTVEMRLLALIESTSGFALISLAVTYLITVYSALERKRAVALSFYHQAEEGADVASFIAHHFVEGRFYGLETALRMATRDIQELLESHVEHPVIHYFHPVEVYKSLPRVLFLVLETCAVIRSCLDREMYPETCQHPEVRSLQASARHVLRELYASLDLEIRSARSKETPFEEARRWEQRFKQTMRRLREAGIITRRDVEMGWEQYRAQREEWESTLQRFAAYLGYEWDEVTGDRDLRYAADEEMEKQG